MLTKSKNYYWDQEAVREQANPETQRSKGVNSGIAEGNVFNGDRRQNYEKDRHTVSARNIRSVWEFPTKPYPGAHFAVFPDRLPEICIRAATPEVGCCSKCGAPWARVIEKTGHINKREPAHVPNNTPTKTDSTGWAPVAMGTDNWQPTCKCDAPRVLSLVLDPFAGAGTTLAVAKREGRRAVGYELSGGYCKLVKKRAMAVTPPMVGLYG